MNPLMPMYTSETLTTWMVFKLVMIIPRGFINKREPSKVTMLKMKSLTTITTSFRKIMSSLLTTMMSAITILTLI